MPAGDPGPLLRGGRSECEALNRMPAGVRAGQSGVLVPGGESGVGKTALLDYLARQARGCHAVRAAGAESELELAFVALHQLCGSMLDRLAALPGPQRDALAKWWREPSRAPAPTSTQCASRTGSHGR
jgi:hypothetical protein